MEKQMRKHNRNKKSIYIWLAIACLAFILLNPGDSLQFTGHRGGRDLVPENTMPAFEMAIAEGADFAELDVQQTKDKVLVVFHDDNLARITGQDINIWDITYDELSKLDAGSYLSPEYVGVGIPTLQQVLKTCKGRLKLNIEIKMNGHATEDFVKQIIDMVTEEGCSNQCILTSFDYGAVEQAKAVNPRIKTGYITADAAVDFMQYPQADCFSIAVDVIDADMVSAAHALNKQVHVWTVNSDEDLLRCKELGVDNIITDHPGHAVKLLRQGN